MTFGTWLGQTSFTRFAQPGERRIANRLIRAALADGSAISVNDGYEWTVERSTSAKTIRDALCTTDADLLHIHRRDLNNASGWYTVGSVYLVWGNDPTGEELIADHSDNDTTAALVARAAFLKITGE